MARQQSIKMSNELHVILESGTLDQVRAVLNGLPPGEINNPNKQGHTALQLAVKAGDEELVRLLMQYGSDIDQGNYSGQTALFLACWNNKPSMVKLLLSMNANLNLQDNRGWTALMIGSYNGLHEIVRLLLQSGADPRVADSFGKRPADRAKDPAIIRMLRDASDEFTLASVPLAQRNSSPPPRGKTPNRVTTEEGSQSSAGKAKRNLSAGVTAYHSQRTTPIETKRVKEVESAAQLKQLAAQLVAQSQTVLQQSISNYIELTLQKQVAQFEEHLWGTLLTKFEERQFVTFDCLGEYLALKLRIGMAHLGIKVPDDLLLDYQQQGRAEFQQGFQAMLASETARLQGKVALMNGRQAKEASVLEDKISTVARNIGISANQGPVVLQHLQQSFLGTCQRLFDKSTEHIQVSLMQRCPVIEQALEERMDAIMDKAEREMKRKVEDMVQRCVGEVKEHVQEVDGWIHRKTRNTQDKSLEVLTSQQVSPKVVAGYQDKQQNLQQVFQKQNHALKEKINQLKSTLSPKNLK